MKKSILVLGLGRFGATLATSLCQLGQEVTAVDANAARVDVVKNLVTHALQANVSDERAISQLGVRNYDCVAVCIGEDIRAVSYTHLDVYKRQVLSYGQRGVGSDPGCAG